MIRLTAWRAPLGLYALALVAGALAASRVAFPPTEVSAYVVAAARNLVDGRGLISDTLWSYASGPLVVPRAAFDLWQPLPGLLAALTMAVLGPSLAAAQFGSVLLGATIAPLTWWVAAESAGRDGLEGRRAATVALGAGLVAVVFGPFLVAMAGPDSAVPFTVFSLAACAVMPRALGAGRGAGVLLGGLLGLAYLSRQEAVWLGLAYLLLVPRAQGVRVVWRAVRWPILAGAAVVLPWLIRNALTFEGGFLRQVLENAWFTRNEDVFAYLGRPTLGAFLAQGPGGILGHIAAGLAHDLLDVLLVPGAPVGLLGLLALVALRRSPALRETGPLRALVLAGAVTFFVTGLVFPVATLWGTYGHSAGPALVALIVLSALGVDRVVARAAQWRGWARDNAWLAPLATLAVVLPAAVLSVALTAAGAGAEQRRADALRAAVGHPDTPVITDHPMWVAAALGARAIALPDEPPANVAILSRAFGAEWLLVLDERGRYPRALLGADQRCFEPQPLAGVTDARLFRILPGCLP